MHPRFYQPLQRCRPRATTERNLLFEAEFKMHYRLRYYRVVNELIESGDPRAKVVGKRRPPAPGSECLKAAAQINDLCSRLRIRPFRVKRGVYRFESHEQADEWMMKLYLS